MKYLDDKLAKPTDKSYNRKRSDKQEKKLAKEFGGKTTINSGATFGQNDIITPVFEIEAKTTSKKSFTLKLEDLKKLQRKCDKNKVPIFIVEFEGNDEYVIVNKNFFTLWNSMPVL